MDLPENAQPLPNSEGPESNAGEVNDYRKHSESGADSQHQSEPQARPDQADDQAEDSASSTSAPKQESGQVKGDAKHFLEVLHPDAPGNWFEIRVITERKKEDPKEKPRVIARRFYDRLSMLLAGLPDLCLLAEHKRAGVFFGVLPRREKGKGKATDTLPGKVAWLDVDFKDFEGGEEEARALLARFAFPPSIVVRSGHGIHCYWLLSETLRSAELADLSKLLAAALGGDHAFDAARILRLPGTFNLKDPSAPIVTTIELLDAERVYSADALRAAAIASAPKKEEPHADVDDDEDYEGADYSGEDDGDPNRPLPDGLPPSILALIAEKKHIRCLFHGDGKTETRPDGKRADTSSSGYDWSFALAVARAGVIDVTSIAAALLCRPDGGAKRKGQDYAERTARKAVEFLQKARQELVDLSLDFKVQAFKVFDSNPPRFEMTVEGVTFVLSSGQLRSPGRFADAFLCALRRIPSIPPKREDWTPVVNALLKDAVLEAMPPEASDEPVLREDIEWIIADLPVGEVPEDLKHGKVVVLPDGRRAFRCEAILKRLKDDGRDVERQDLCRHLHRLGYASAPERVGGTPVRVWRRNTVTP